MTRAAALRGPREATPDALVSTLELDLASQPSVRAAAAAYAAAPHGRKLHVLINNAGNNFWGLPPRYTADGIGACAQARDRRRAAHDRPAAVAHARALALAHRAVGAGAPQVNFLGPFTLTRLLLPQLLAAAPSRVVTVSSVMHRSGTLKPRGAPAFLRRYDAGTYSHAKLAEVLFTYELDRRTAARGVRAVAGARLPSRRRPRVAAPLTITAAAAAQWTRARCRPTSGRGRRSRVRRSRR